MSNTMFNKFALDANMIMAFLKDANVVGADVNQETMVVTLYVDESDPDVTFSLKPLFDTKVDKVLGKELSDNNLTDALLARLVEIQDQIQTDWEQTDTNQPDYLKNKPTIHYHDNKEVLDKLTVVDDELLYNNHPVDSVVADWSETNPDHRTFIANKPVLYDPSNKDVLNAINEDANQQITYNGIVISGVQSDWVINSPSDPAYILNKPILYDPSNKDILDALSVDGNNHLTYEGFTVATDIVQSDWTEIDNTKPAFIRHKPAIHHHANLTNLAKIDEDINNHMYYNGYKVAYEEDIITNIATNSIYGIMTNLRLIKG